ncbi:uncharacterized protein C5orf52 homolog [Orycteropus afer afer]|uniref:Uncharacterized protein C5orf52 homolog n=1 Tax=Orycteropus afer afer TaxID=1230840 RepID=A0A8B7AX45_ORYAF|nr:uncharacterized protein C5orf52 homolog [Orycteropus afer afer]
MPLVSKHPLAPIPELYPSAEDAWSSKPSVTRNPSSLVAFDTAVQETTSSQGAQASGFRRSSRETRSEVGLGTQPQIHFLQPRAAQTPVLFSLMNSSEAMTMKFLPKSRLSQVILRDNLRAQRVFEMETRALDKTKKKMSRFYDHLKKKFMTDQIRKLERWRRESMKLQQYLDSIRPVKVQFKLEPNKRH